MIKEIPMLFNGDMVREILAGRKTKTRRPLKKNKMPVSPIKVGDLIWVRETFKLCDGESCKKTHYKASFSEYECQWYGSDIKKWTPSIHMPKFIARIWLEVVSVRFEPIQSISESDARAEGSNFRFDIGECGSHHDSILNFKEIWNACYKNSWNRNDTVCVVEFKVAGER